MPFMVGASDKLCAGKGFTVYDRPDCVTMKSTGGFYCADINSRG